MYKTYLKERICYLYVAVVALLCTACNEQKSLHATLERAEALMELHPDSALTLLESVSADDLSIESEQAYYALLLTQARDKNYLQQDDSLIRFAVNHYNRTDDTQMQALAYFYLGSVYRDQNQQSLSLDAYLKALHLTEKNGNDFLRGRIYGNMGHLYYAQQLYEKADSTFYHAENIAKSQNDTSLWIESLAMQGEIKVYQRKYLEAEQILLEATTMLNSFKQEQILLQVADALCVLYSLTGKGENCLKYAKLHLAIKKNYWQYYRSFILSGEAYYKLSKYDSAFCYFSEALKSSELSDKYNAYMRLADIALIKGDSGMSIKMERPYSAYKDSLRLSSQKTDFIAKEIDSKVQNERKAHREMKTKYKYYSMIFIIAVVFIFSLQYQKNKKKQLIIKDNANKQLYRLQKEKKELAQRNLEGIVAYQKITSILCQFKKCGIVKDRLNDTDWIDLQIHLDKTGVIDSLSLEYDLSIKEKHLCILLLLDLSLTDRAHIMNFQRQNIYRIEKEILKKMGKSYEAGKLQKIIKEFLMSPK